MGEGERDDLAGVGGRIGEDLLVAGHAVLKQTSPAELPVAPSPCPAMTVPSASTRRAVSGVSVQERGRACHRGRLQVRRSRGAGGARLPVGQSAYGWRRTLGEGADLVNSAALRLDRRDRLQPIARHN